MNQMDLCLDMFVCHIQRQFQRPLVQEQIIGTGLCGAHACAENRHTTDGFGFLQLVKLALPAGLSAVLDDGIISAGHVQLLTVRQVHRKCVCFYPVQRNTHALLQHFRNRIRERVDMVPHSLDKLPVLLGQCMGQHVHQLGLLLGQLRIILTVKQPNHQARPVRFVAPVKRHAD